MAAAHLTPADLDASDEAEALQLPDVRELGPASRTSRMIPPQQRHWSGRVLDDLRGALPMLAGVVVEIHAGTLYYGRGLLHGLRAAGAIVRVPLRRVTGIGPQCRWYREQAAALGREGRKG